MERQLSSEGVNTVRRHLRKVLFGASFLIFLSPAECVDWYCDRHEDFPPICGEIFFPA